MLRAALACLGAGLCVFFLVSCSDECDDEKPNSATPSWTEQQCSENGGKLIADPGDGSTYRNGCPDCRKLLATVKFGAEGGICCV